MDRYLEDPNTDNYISRCPKLQLASLTTINIVAKTTTTIDMIKSILRYFNLKTSIYENKDEVNKYTLTYLFSNSNHFKHTLCPKKHAMVFVFGHIIEYII